MRRGNFQHARQRIDAWKSTLRLTVLVHLLSVLMLWTAPPPGAKGEHFFEGNLEAWRALEKAHEAGKLRAIGVSNFQQADLDNILDNATVRPAVKKVLAHVGNTPFDLIEYSRSKGILVEA